MTVLGNCENGTCNHAERSRPWFFVQDSVMPNLFQHPGGFSEYVTYSHSELVSESRASSFFNQQQPTGVFYWFKSRSRNKFGMTILPVILARFWQNLVRSTIEEDDLYPWEDWSSIAGVPPQAPTSVWIEFICTCNYSLELIFCSYEPPTSDQNHGLTTHSNGGPTLIVSQ